VRFFRLRNSAKTGLKQSSSENAHCSAAPHWMWWITVVNIDANDNVSQSIRNTIHREDSLQLTNECYADERGDTKVSKKTGPEFS
jgi:hypothetical protein